MPTKYIHTNIVSKDWRALADFYINVFDCKILSPERDLSGEWLDRGTGVKDAQIRGVHLLLPGFGENGPTLEVFQYDKNEEKPSSPKSNREGFGHIAFHVDNVEVMSGKIIQFGGTILGEIATKDFPGGLLVFVYATDPEGNIIEIQNWRKV